MLDFQDKHHKKTLIHDDLLFDYPCCNACICNWDTFSYGPFFVETASGNGSWENPKNFVSFGIPYHQADTLPSQGESVADLIFFFQICVEPMCIENKNLSAMETYLFVPSD